MSNTENVKLGACRIRWGGVDLGYTKGGVEVTVKTDTHKVQIDQFGQSVISEIIMARDCMVKAPLAETTLDLMARVMPGASLVTDGASASGSITVATNPGDGKTITVNGAVFTFRSAPTAAREVKIGTSATATAANLLFALQGSNHTSVNVAGYTKDATVATKINITYISRGVIGNSFTLAQSAGTEFTFVAMAGGSNATLSRVDVTNAIGVNLLTVAQELVLHPMDLPDHDTSFDFIVPLASTAGGLNFSYKFDNERVYDVEFSAYPDASNNNVLFQFGNKLAISSSASTLDIRPRWSLSATGNQVIDATFFNAATAFGTSNVSAGSFQILTASLTPAKYGFVFVPQSAIPVVGHVTFTSASAPGFPGGWDGYGLAGANNGTPPQAAGTHGTYVDANGTIWWVYRQDFSQTTGETWTIS